MSVTIDTLNKIFNISKCIRKIQIRDFDFVAKYCGCPSCMSNEPKIIKLIAHKIAQIVYPKYSRKEWKNKNIDIHKDINEFIQKNYES